MTDNHPQNQAGWGQSYPSPPVPQAAPQTSVSTAPAASLSGPLNPYVVSGAAAVLFVISLIALFLTWVKVTITMTIEDFSMRVEGTMNGFGMMKLTENVGNTSDSETVSRYLVLGILALLCLLGGIACVLVRQLPRFIGPLLFIISGVLFLVSAVIGLVSDEVAGVEEGATGGGAVTGAERQMIDDMLAGTDVSKGPGQYIIIVVALLLIALGAVYLALAQRAGTLGVAGARPVSTGFPGAAGHPGVRPQQAPPTQQAPQPWQQSGQEPGAPQDRPNRWS